MTDHHDTYAVHELTVPLFSSLEQTAGTLRWQMLRNRDYTITLDVADSQVTATGSDLFNALQQIRLRLESLGWVIAVQGARRDTWASGMLRDTIGARRVYVLHDGRHTRQEHLVDIFAEAPLDSIGNVKQQQAYYREWLRSPRQ